MVIYRLNVGIQKSLSSYIYAYMRGIAYSNTRKTYTQSKARIMAVILRRFRGSNSQYNSQTRCLNSHNDPYIQQSTLFSI